MKTRKSACARCRRMKYKCIYTAPGQVSCDRCVKSAIECSTESTTFTERSDYSNGRVSDSATTTTETVSTENASEASWEVGQPSLQESIGALNSALNDESIGLFRYCRVHVLAVWPIIIVPAEMDAKSVLSSRPLLYKAMIATAAIVSGHPARLNLRLAVRQSVLTSIIEHCRRSIELMQCLLLLSTWSPTFDRDTVLNNATFTSLALQLAAELQPKEFNDLWDRLEFDRCYAALFITHNSTKMWQANGHTFSRPVHLAISSNRLCNGTDFEKNLAMMSQQIEETKPYTLGSMTEDVYEAVLNQMNQRHTMLEMPLNICLRLALPSIYLHLLELRLSDPSADTDASTLESGRLVIRYRLHDLCKVMDELAQSDPNSVPSFMLVRPVISLVILGRLSQIIRDISIFYVAAFHIRKRMESLAMASLYCVHLLSRIAIVEAWFQSNNSSPISSLADELDMHHEYQEDLLVSDFTTTLSETPKKLTDFKWDMLLGNS